MRSLCVVAIVKFAPTLVLEEEKILNKQLQRFRHLYINQKRCVLCFILVSHHLSMQNSNEIQHLIKNINFHCVYRSVFWLEVLVVLCSADKSNYEKKRTFTHEICPLKYIIQIYHSFKDITQIYHSFIYNTQRYHSNIFTPEIRPLKDRYRGCFCVILKAEMRRVAHPGKL